jgi:hypothetical protein
MYINIYTQIYIYIYIHICMYIYIEKERPFRVEGGSGTLGLDAVQGGDEGDWPAHHEPVCPG